MKPAESMASMESSGQRLKLVLKQPEYTAVFKCVNTIRPKSLAEGEKDTVRMEEMSPNAGRMPGTWPLS
jgi:hypothetical protein